jgi:uncharacterized membrane protein
VTHHPARGRPRSLVAALLALVLALAPTLGAMAQAHEALHEVAAPTDGHFHAAAAEHGDCRSGDAGTCADSDEDSGGLHRLAHAVDCCAHVVANLPAVAPLHEVPRDGQTTRVDHTATPSRESQPLLEPPIR